MRTLFCLVYVPLGKDKKFRIAVNVYDPEKFYFGKNIHFFAAGKRTVVPFQTSAATKTGGLTWDLTSICMRRPSNLARSAITSVSVMLIFSEMKRGII